MKRVFTGLMISLAIGGSLAAPDANAGDYYAFGNIGNADTKFRSNINDVIDDDDSAFSLGLGYDFSQYFSAQVAFHDFGEPTGFAGCPPEVLCIQAFAPEPVEMTGWSASLVGTLPLNDDFSVYGQLGLLSWDASARSPTLNDSGTDLLVGAGLNWHVSKQWAISAGYEVADVDIKSTKLGLQFRF